MISRKEIGKMKEIDQAGEILRASLDEEFADQGEGKK